MRVQEKEEAGVESSRDPELVKAAFHIPLAATIHHHQLASMTVEPPGRLPVALAGTLVVAGFLLNLYVGASFGHQGLYQIPDSLFDADASIYVPMLLSHDSISARHPLMLFFHLPVRLFSGAVVYALSPLAGAGKTLLLILLGRRLRWSLPLTVLIVLLDMFSTSRILIGSIPESFALGSSGLVWLLWLVAKRSAGDEIGRWQWLACGTFLMGITVTNLLLFLLCYTLVECRVGGWRPKSLRQPAAVGAAAVVLFVGIYGAGLLYVRSAPPIAAPALATVTAAIDQNGHGPGVATRFLRFDPATVLAQVPFMVVHPLIAPRPDFQGMFVLPLTFNTGFVLAFLAVLVSLALGIAGYSSAPKPARDTGLAALVLLAASWTIHVFFAGPILFLYTLQWQPSLLLGIAGVGYRGRAVRLVGLGWIVLLLGMAGTASWRAVDFIQHCACLP